MKHLISVLAFVLAFFGIAHAQSVSTITVQRPAPIVRATVPLEPGLAWDPVASPLQLVSPDGVALPTQWEQVLAYPDGSVRVAELLAVVPVAAGPVCYDVVEASVRDARAKPAPWAAAWLGNPPRLVVDGVERSTTWSSVSHRFGGVAITRRFFARNFVGWVTAWHGLDVVQLELVVHNGHPGSPDMFFDSIELAAPAGSTFAAPCWPQPGLSTLADGKLQLVGKRSDGFAHALVQRGSHCWSLVLHDGSQSKLAAELAAGAGWGVASAWTDVDAFGAASLRLPHLAYRAGTLAADLRGEWSAFSGALASGSPVGMTSGGVGRLDWQHPWNPKYGGVTGGGFRHQWHGVDLAATGEPAGLQLFQARLATLMDRHAVVITQPNGVPLVLEQWLDASGKPRGWSVSASDARFDGKTDGPFGFAAVQGVNVGARTPPELAHFKQPIAGSTVAGAFYPIDFQHWDRALQDAEALVQLDHSPVAEWWLKVNAETWRMSLVSQGRLAGALAGAKQRPGWGSPWGRAHGHGMRFASMAYAVGDAPWRARWQPVLADCAELMITAQGPTGLWRRDESSKNLASSPFLGRFALTKGTEEALLANGALGLARSVGVHDAELVDAVDRWSCSGLWDYLWGSGSTGGAPTDYVAIAPKGEALWPDAALALRLNADREEIASPLGAAMLLRRVTGVPLAPEQVAAARRWCGNAPDPLAWLKVQSNYKLLIDDCAPLHAALEIAP